MSDLVLRDVRKTYRTKGRPEVEAVRGFDLEVNSGELVGLLGPSGCGKSTTLRMIAGLEDVTGGDIAVGGRSMVGLPPQKRSIGVAFENYALYPPLTVAENIAFGMRARGHRKAERAARVADVAGRIGLSDILDAHPAGLSSGQKQRVALARAVAREPEVLLLDEPLSHLDAAQRDVTRRELRHLQQELGYTTILVTHDQEEALSLADRVVVMNDGVVQQVGTPDVIYDDPVNLFVAQFVGEPAMNILDGRLDDDGVRLSPDLTIPVRTREPRHDRAVTVGVRPEDVTLTGAAEAHATGTVVVYEDLQEYGLATIELPGVDTRVVAQTAPGLTLNPGETQPIAFYSDRTYLFETHTGERLR
ncbi:ABC transporter ATP-binding protein [Stackebrandtia nassauensis]|uniref:ABC transporter related protein n=1 Tax=Stackebrandtia nassauensis (strain DSM 44728 / CIP 108903 / NRRL B-16338 / NBRC 102104 / LLR-40K-21) TaxID=446470 RepID=D3Q0X2_STANL|nr:ABC transporter ATP-binding protein [Stackebrandtia nassauensis]ADD43722.1 ABC transporter related protein [Stackebrandtia nassauensis DSM 44728]